MKGKHLGLTKSPDDPMIQSPDGISPTPLPYPGLLESAGYGDGMGQIFDEKELRCSVFETR